MYTMDIKGIQHKSIYELGDAFKALNPEGRELGFTNYYMTYNREPMFGISGEFHFSRYPEALWEQELLKMKMGGIEIISTYVFWNHHEEVEGSFNFTGRRDLGKFVALCHRHGLYVILRIGPFNHGEVRNGGLPDWLYGKPYRVRHTNAEFMEATKRLYTKIHEQVKGMFYNQGGPIIGVQLDNEYMHSCAPWEMTTGVSNEWVPVGNEGDDYILRLKEMAYEIGIRPVFYTCTAWGGAIAPDFVMPLWGGYAYRPWLFYRSREMHPSTEEYIYQDYHNNDKPKGHDFEPRYLPESKPYACCEMGGGMMCSYNYRFQLPYKSVDAMANIKMASGCNFLGYYVFHGGTNPKGETYAPLNESQVSKISYDYQAAIGEVGQIRESYQRLKVLHYFAKSMRHRLCPMKTLLPEGASSIDPHDLETLRYAIRTDGKSGFVFINNFQDHEVNCPIVDETIRILTDTGELLFEHLSLEAEENCILPFGIPIGNFWLEKATAQLILTTILEGVDTGVFLRPEGMCTKFYFDHLMEPVIADESKDFQVITVKKEEEELTIILLSRRLANMFYWIEDRGLIFTDGPLMIDGEQVIVELMKSRTRIATYPTGLVSPWENSLGNAEFADGGILQWGLLENQDIGVALTMEEVGPYRYTVKIPAETFEKDKRYVLVVDYEGDIGQAFIQGECIHDQFYNGDLWYIPLIEYQKQLCHEPLTIYITPLKEGVYVDVDTTMAGRSESVEKERGLIRSITLDAYSLKDITRGK